MSQASNPEQNTLISPCFFLVGQKWDNSFLLDLGALRLADISYELQSATEAAPLFRPKMLNRSANIDGRFLFRCAGLGSPKPR